MTRAGIVALGLLLAASAAEAQGDDTLTAGMKVRVRSEPGGEFEGRLVSTQGGVLDIASGRSRVQVPLGDVTRLEVARGGDRSLGARRGALVGAPVGLIAGGALLLRDDSCRTSPLTGVTTCEQPSTPLTIGLATLVGIGVGAFIGHALGVERWEAVTPPGRSATLRVTPWLAPTGAAGIAVTLR